MPKLSYHINVSLALYLPILNFSLCQKTNLHLYKGARLNLYIKYLCQTLVIIYIAKPLICNSPQCYHCLLIKPKFLRFSKSLPAEALRLKMAIQNTQSTTTITNIALTILASCILREKLCFIGAELGTGNLRRFRVMHRFSPPIG